MRKKILTVSLYRHLVGRFFTLIALGCFIFGSTGKGYAQNALQWKYYTNGDQVNAIADQNGTIWMGTNGGLVKLESTGQETFYTHGNSQLPVNNVLALAIDGQGNKWIGTNGGGIAKFDGSTWTIYNTSNSILPTDVIRDIKVDANGVVWAASYDADGTNGGVVKFEDGLLSLIALDDGSYQIDQSVASIAMDTDNNVLWVGTDGNDLMKLEGGTQTYYHASYGQLPENYEISDLAVASDGSVWLVMSSGQVVNFDGTNWTVFDTYSTPNLPSNAQAIDIDANGNVLIGTDGGLYIYDGTDISSNFPLDNGVFGFDIKSVHADANGNIWEGTNEHNIAKYDGSNWTHYESSNSGLLKDISIREMLYASNGDLWITTESSHGIMHYDGTTWNTMNSNNSGLTRNDIQKLAEDNNGNIWASSAYGIFIYDGSSWTQEDGYLSSSYNISYSALNDMAVDTSNNHVWVAPGHSGIIEYNGSTWTQYKSSLDITAIYPAADGNIWFAYEETDGGGLLKYDGTHWTDYAANDYNLVDFQINDITADQNGTLWLGSYYHGIYSFNGTNFVEYKKENSALTSARVRNLEFDESGNLWIAFNDYLPSIAKFDGKTFHVYSSENSKLTNSFPTAMVIDDAGNKWIGNAAGELIELQGGSAPTAEFTADIHSGSAPLTVNFTDLTGSATATYEWTFNGGTPSSSTDQNPQVTFNSTGTYTVSLKVTNAYGSDLETKSGYITVRDANAPAETNWTNYTNGGVINDVTHNGSMIWAATNGGLTSYNKTDGSYNYYNRGNSGLPSNHINQLAFDSQGQLWAATEAGLVMFDGTDWHVYSTENSEIPADEVTALTIDNNDKIWLATVTTQYYSSQNQGLISFDGTTWKTESTQIPSQNAINTIVIDNSGKVWVGLDGGGLSVYDGSTVHTYTSSASGLPNDNVNAVTFDSNGTAWVGTLGGLAEFDGTTWTTHGIPQLVGTIQIGTNDLAFDSKGNLWVGSSALGLLKFDGSEFTSFDTDNTKIASNNIQSVYVDQDDHIWSGAAYSLLVNNSSEKSALTEFDGLTFTIYQTSNSGLPSNSVSNIVFDEQGNAWMGADAQLGIFSGNAASGGLVKYDGTNWTLFDANNSAMPDANVNGLAVNGNNIWIATSKGLANFDGIRWQVFGQDELGTTGSNITDVAVDADGNIWALVQENGVVKYDGSNWNLYKPSDSNYSLNAMNQIEVSSGGMVWIGTADNGIYSFDGTNWTAYTASNGNLTSDAVAALHVGDDGTVWATLTVEFGSASYLCKYDGSSWSEIKLPDGSGTISGIETDDNGLVWLAESSTASTANGQLAYYDGNNFTILTQSNSRLTEKGLDAVSIDSHGRVWIGSQGGGAFVYNGSELPTDIKDEQPARQNLPTNVQLSQNYPNPFNPTTRIQYALPEAAKVRITVYNVLGRRVVELVNNRQSAGIHAVTFDASHLASGVYIYRMRTGNTIKTQKMLLIK